MSRRAVRSVAASLCVSALLVGAGVASAATTGLWVTQRGPDHLATSTVAAFTLGAFENSLSAPVFAGAADTESFGIAITPDGAHLYVTNDNDGNSLSQFSISPTTGGLTALTPATVAVTDYTGSEPEGVTVDPTGRWVYVAAPFGGSVSQLRVDPTTGALTLAHEFRLPSNPDPAFPTGVAFSPDGKSLYVADYGNGDIAEFDVDPLTGAITPKSTSSVSATVLGDGFVAEPRRVVAATIGGNDYLYASDFANNLIVQFAIDATTGELTEESTAPSDAGPTGLVVDHATTPASLFAAAETGGTGDEYDVDSSTGALTAKAGPSITTGSGPDGLALAPDGKELYVGDSGDSNLNLYTVAADGTLAADPTNPQIAAGDGPSTPLVHALPSAPTAPPTPVGGALTPLAAPNDCLTGATFGCNTLIASDLNADYQSVVSPDGKNVYAAAYLGDLVEFTRNTSTGALSELRCDTDRMSSCADGSAYGANNPRALAISPDGNNVYVVGAEDALAIFSRDPSTGALTWIGCLRNSDSRCTPVTGLAGPNGVAVSPDGTSVYVTSGQDSSIAEFSRDPATGLLTQLPPNNDCISSDPLNPGGCGSDSAAGLANPVGVAVSPDSANVYVSAGGLGPGDVAEFSRNRATGALTQLASPNDCMTSPSSGVSCGTAAAVGFNGGEEDIAISPDGHNVYLNSFGDSAVIELSRNGATGALTQLASPNDCITSDSTNPAGCGTHTASALNGVQGVAVSPDGLDLYASASGPVTASGASNAIDEFQRNPLTGALTEIASPFDCVTENGSGCAIYNVNGLGQPRRLTVSPNGANVYAVGQADGGTVVELARTHPSADLSIGESGAPSSANTGTTVTYSYTMSDIGPSDVDAPVVTVPLASEETLVSALSSQGSCSGNPTVHCALGPLLAGTSATVTVKASLDSAGTASVTAAVADTGDVTDPNPPNNSVTTSTVVHSVAPVNNALPAITGAAQEDQTLNAGTGGWTNSPTGYTYQWERCNSSGTGCNNILGATASGYVVGVDDIGDTLRVSVTASNLGGHNSATSLPTPVVLIAAPGNQGLPAISGLAQQGQALAATNGAWTNSPTSYSYQWERCDTGGAACANIAGASASGYVPSAADVGHTLRVVVTASNDSGSTPATSAQTAAVLISAPVNDTAPAITGSAVQAQVLSASTGGWENSPAGFAYQWLQCDATGNGCASIAGATASSYVPVAADADHALRVSVTASNAGGSSSATSAQTQAVIGLQLHAALAPPILASSADLSPVSGKVLIKLPGNSTFTALVNAINVPLGSTIDVTHGVVTLTVALPGGATQTGQFYGGEFILTQTAKGMTIATLTGGSYAGCPVPPKPTKHKGAALIATAKKKPGTVIRQLWGNAHGNYTTKGRYGSAAVSGTIWLTQDRCDGTYVRVTKDNVIVIAYAHPHHKHNIRQGHHILIPAAGS